MEDLQNKLNASLESGFIKKILNIREGRIGLNLVSGMRNLTTDEINILVKQNNTSTDWNRIEVSHDFIPDYITGSAFHGECLIGRFDGTPVDAWDGLQFPCWYHFR